MKLLLSLLGVFLLCACSAQSTHQQKDDITDIRGGIRLERPGISFTPPTNHVWSIFEQSPSKIMLGTRGYNNYETLGIMVVFYHDTTPNTKEELLDRIKTMWSKEPATARYEDIASEYSVDNQRKEICIRYKVTTLDHERKRNGKVVIFDKYGIFCVYPYQKDTIARIEYSRQAPTSHDNTPFMRDGDHLFESIHFKPE